MYRVVRSPANLKAPMTELEAAKVRSVYLVTYSQADLGIFPDRRSFADAVCEAVAKCEGPTVPGLVVKKP